MRVTGLYLAGLAYASLGSSATIGWSGSVGLNSTSKPYSSCNGTTAGPTGPTGTAPPVSSTPRSSRNGTTVGPTGPTGTAPHNLTSTRTRCLATTTITVISYSIVTSGLTLTTRTVLGDGPIIYGDTLTPTNGTATATIPATATSVIPGTTTLTFLTVVQTTVGTPGTITVPPPADFLPIQSSLPNATYNFSNPCDVSSLTTTSTSLRFGPAEVQTTLSGTLIVFVSEQQVYSAASFTNYSISYVTTTSTTTQYEATASTSIAGDATNTFTATTTTVYAACATNNFADSVVINNNPQYISFFDYITSNQSFSGLVSGNSISGPYDCCNYAFAQNADVWTYAIGLGCAIITGTDGLCTPAQTGDTAELPSDPIPGDLHLVLGNAVCARFTKSIFA